MNGYAQKWAIKPFIGGHYNTVDHSANDTWNLPYTSSSLNHPIRYTYGVILSYQFNPKWGAEIGYKRTPSSIWVDYTHPYTGANLGSYSFLTSHNTLTLNANYTFYDNQKWLRLKGLAGLEFQNNKKGVSISNGETVPGTDTTFSMMLDQNQRFLTYMNLGIGAEFLVKRKPLAEFRITTGLGYRYNWSVQSKLKYDGHTYNNTYSTTGTYVNAVFLLNLNTVLGKWKD
jgi:hypothetical protein